MSSEYSEEGLAALMKSLEKNKQIEEGAKVRRVRDYKRMLRLKNQTETLKSKAALLAAKLEMSRLKESQKKGVCFRCRVQT